MIGGIWYGARRWRLPTEEQYPRFNLAPRPGPCPAHLGAVRSGDGRADGARRAGDCAGNRDRVPAGRPDRPAGHLDRGLRLGDHRGSAWLGAGSGAHAAPSSTPGTWASASLLPSPAPGSPGSPRCWAGRCCASPRSPPEPRARRERPFAPVESMMMPPSDRIVISGARAHNLKGIDVELPRDALIVITGPLGLGQVEPRLRHDLRRGAAPLRRVAVRLRAPVPGPDGEARRGLDRGPLARRSRSTRRRPRATRAPRSGTVTEIYDYLRLLWARIGKPHCYNCGAPISGQSLEQITDRVLTLAEGTRFMVMAPVVRGRKGEYGRLLERDARPGLRAGADRRRAAPPRRADRARQEVQARHLGRRRPPGDEGGGAKAPLRVGRGGLAAGRRPGGDRDAARWPSCGRPGRARRRCRRRGRNGDAVLGALRLPQLRHLDARAGAADLLLQLAPRLLPALPRAGLSARHRPRADRPRPDPVDLGGGAGSVDEGRLGVPPAAAGGRRRGERDRHRHPLAGPARERSRAAPGGNRRRASHGLLPQPLRPAARLHGPLRRHAGQPRATLREHGLGEHPRANRGADGPAALPGLRRSAPAAGEPRGHGGRAQHLRVHAVQRAGRPGVDRGAGADRHRAGDRAPGGARDRRAPALPRQRRDRLPVAGARRRDPLGRRGPADPARDPDRLVAGGRPLHPRRALDRPPPA